MKVNMSNIRDVDKFFQVIDSCVGRVELVSSEGDRLNLKSKLSQYVSLAKVFSDGTISELDIIAYEQEDIEKLLTYMING
ncbi:MAG: polya polymerase [Lachnospiraceae bacterium]|nr:polya polymerase [Lachnospiraceae bacterium]